MGWRIAIARGYKALELVDLSGAKQRDVHVLVEDQKPVAVRIIGRRRAIGDRLHVDFGDQGLVLVKKRTETFQRPQISLENRTHRATGDAFEMPSRERPRRPS